MWANQLHRLLDSLKVSCEVIAPALIPVAPGPRVRPTGVTPGASSASFVRASSSRYRVLSSPRRQCGTFPGSEVTPSRTSPRGKNRLSHFLLRHGRPWHGETWTLKYRSWLSTQHFDHPALEATFRHYRSIVECREAELTAIEAALSDYFDAQPFAEPVRRLSAYRGIDRPGALVLQAEVCDWRRFSSREDVGAFCGLVPSESSSGESIQRGSITRAGDVHLRRQLIEAAWSYRSGPSIGVTLRRRQEGVLEETRTRSGRTSRPVSALPRTA